MNQLQLDTDEVILFEKEKVKRESNKSFEYPQTTG